MIRESTRHLENVKTLAFQGLLVHAVRQWKARAVVKGLRTVTDYEFELQMALMNREMGVDVETLFIPAAMNVNFLSSSLIKEVAMEGGDISQWVPPGVEERLRRKLASTTQPNASIV